ncbi:MAG: tetratricopeptide repeat protein [Chitinophagales bacterium]|nr:tetratricopeptide repeat protein [Chitinophagales bacterium]
MDASVTTPQKSNPADIEAGDIELVPRAGREIDFAENGLVNEHRVGYKTATPFVIIGKYLTLLLAPVNLHFYYGYNVIPLVNWAHPIPILVTVILIVVVVFSIMRAKHFPALTFGLVYLTLCLLALSNFGVLVTGMVGERLMYVGSLGFCIALAAVLLQVFKVPKVNVTQYKQIPPVFFFAISIIILGYSVRTITRNTVWKDRLTLFEHDTRNGYPSAKAQQLAGLANVTKAQENFQNSEMYINKAKAYFGKSLSIYPDFTSALQGMAMLYAFKNDCANAMPFLKRSLEIEPFRPEVNYHYAVCLDQLEKYDTAAIYYERVITQTPMDIVAYSNLSFDYYRLGLYERSIQVNQKAISLMPNQIDPYINIGKTYIQIKNYPEAIKYLERALQLKSNDPQLILGILDLHQRLGNEQAIAYYTDLCKRMGIPIPAQQQTPSNPNP